ncbi:related to Thioredoxin [Rhynchosporium secalis]|uniref:Related to Thioredoxin n=1 Tax=Rhynchosporium secalis TaxID=38038 RepID=A0A1E1LWX5_RHYSE|nr:related to Thioredoxin [Rhynchosporium secalis]
MQLSSLLGALLTTSALSATLPQPDINIHISIAEGKGYNGMETVMNQKHRVHTTGVQDINSPGEFRDILKSEKVVIVEFTAVWCGPCHFIGPQYDQFSTEYPNNKFFKVDIDEQSDIAEEQGIRALPAFKAYKNGDVVGELVGAIPSGLKSMIDKAIAKD